MLCMMDMKHDDLKYMQIWSFALSLVMVKRIILKGLGSRE